MNSELKALEKSIEYLTGKKVADLRNKTIDETRAQLEEDGVEVNAFSEFPFIGRGNINRDNIITNKGVNKELDDVID